MLNKADDPDVDRFKAFDVVSQNLERIADFCEDIVDQVQHVESPEVLGQHDFAPFYDEVVAALDRVDQALFGRKVEVALQICRSEHKLDQLYARAFRRTIGCIEESGEAQTQVTALFIYHYFERMGDALLNVGEAVISSCLGERLKISRFWALEDSLEDSLGDGGRHSRGGDVSLAPMADTRSGSRISRIEGDAIRAARSRAVILKEGRPSKLDKERRNIERWHEIMPGLAPRVHSFHEHGDRSATLFEYLPGQTFEELLLVGQRDELDTALKLLFETLTALWEKTREDRPVCARFLHQLKRRMPDVLAVHPEFRRPRHAIGGVAVRSFAELLEEALPALDDIAAPFSVFIHGDFNVDNVIHDSPTGKVRFIDLHRSTMMDYVQDVSVFLVSNYRLQALEQPLRSRLNHVLEQMYEFARGFAETAGDTTFDARLCLGVARSMASSTRFVLDPEMAKEMFFRARYLIEQMVNRREEELSDFAIPMEVFVA